MSLELIIGPVFSGKSSELIKTLLRHQNGAGRKCLCVKFDKDNRFGTAVELLSTRDKVTWNGPTYIASATFLPTFLQQSHWSEYDVIGIDEAQFYTDLVPLVQILLQARKHIIIASLDGRFDQTPFGHTHELLCKASIVRKLEAICRKCGDPHACYSVLCDGIRPEDINNIEIDDGKKFMAVCAKCIHY